MAETQAQFSKEEVSRRGREIYERDIKPTLRTEDLGQFIALDVATGVYEMDADDYTAGKKLQARMPGAQIWLGCAGQEATYRMGRPLKSARKVEP
jgi:hypothetical protein